MKALIFIRDIFRKFPLLLIANTLILVAASITEAASVLAVAPIVDLLIKSDLQNASHITQKAIAVITSIGLPATLGSLLTAFILLNMLRSGLQIFATYLILKTKYFVVRDIMMGTFEDFFSARWYFFSSNQEGKLLNTFIREISAVGEAFGAMARFFSSILQLVVFLAIPFYLSWQVMSVSLGTTLLFASPFILLGRIGYRLGRVTTSTANRIGAVIQESFGSAKVILGFANQHKSIQALNYNFNSHREAAIKLQTLRAAIPLMYYPLGLIVLIITLIAARRFVLSLSEISILIYALFRIIPVVGQITGEKSSMDSFYPSYEQVMNLRYRAKQLKQRTGSKIFEKLNDGIALEGLSFAYPGHEATLKDLSVQIPKGKMIAFVGDSGAGKSTLIDIIMGFNEPLTGRITIDDIPLQEFDIRSYRQRIGYVPQQSILFNMSIKDNILWAKENATDNEIAYACKQANAEEFILGLPQKYDTVVGDRGVRLSGGQVQRVALARAILRKPDLLILDEATSSLDTRSERLIQEAIDNIAKQTTVIVIAHRLSTIVNADYVYVLRSGRVVEEGRYTELIKMKGYFNHMVQLQALEAAQ